MKNQTIKKSGRKNQRRTRRIRGGGSPNNEEYLNGNVTSPESVTTTGTDSVKTGDVKSPVVVTASQNTGSVKTDATNTSGSIKTKVLKTTELLILKVQLDKLTKEQSNQAYKDSNSYTSDITQPLEKKRTEYSMELKNSLDPLDSGLNKSL